VPTEFAGTIGLAAHQRAADYTIAKGCASACWSMAFGAAVLLGWTLLGGLDALNTTLRDAVQPAGGDMAYQLALLAAFTLIGAAIDLPFELYSTFGIEQRFGFNRMTPACRGRPGQEPRWWARSSALPLAALILWIMGAPGGLWWLWAWGAWWASTC
jgi:STE24 endopeptidase